MIDFGLLLDLACMHARDPLQNLGSQNAGSTDSRIARDFLRIQVFAESP